MKCTLDLCTFLFLQTIAYHDLLYNILKHNQNRCFDYIFQKRASKSTDMYCLFFSVLLLLQLLQRGLKIFQYMYLIFIHIDSFLWHVILLYISVGCSLCLFARFLITLKCLSRSIARWDKCWGLCMEQLTRSVERLLLSSAIKTLVFKKRSCISKCVSKKGLNGCFRTVDLIFVAV